MIRGEEKDLVTVARRPWTEYPSQKPKLELLATLRIKMLPLLKSDSKAFAPANDASFYRGGRKGGEEERQWWKERWEGKGKERRNLDDEVVVVGAAGRRVRLNRGPRKVETITTA